MAKGFKGMPGNMQGLMKQAQKMQADLEKAQTEAEELTAEGSAGGGAITVKANGKYQILEVTVSKEVVDPDDVEMLQDLFMAASNEALQKVSDAVKERMASVTGGMSIPGLM